jgi:hypothetical protein
MPRAILCNLANHPYEYSTRTVNEQFLLNPLAAPGWFASKHDNDRVEDAKRLKQDALVAERNAQKRSKLIDQIKAWRSGLGQEPVVTIDTLPETVNNIVGTWLAKAIDHTGVEYYGLDGLMRNDSKAQPKSPKTGRMPLCKCTDKELRILFITAVYIYADAYRAQTRSYLETETPRELELSLGSYPPPKPMRYRYPSNPDRSTLPNLSVR